MVFIRKKSKVNQVRCVKRYALRNNDRVLAIMHTISASPHQIALKADELYSGGQSSVGAATLSFD